MVTTEEQGGQAWGLGHHRKSKKPCRNLCPLLLDSCVTLVVTEMLAKVRLERRDDTKAVWEGRKAICKGRIVWPEERQLRNKWCPHVFN